MNAIVTSCATVVSFQTVASHISETETLRWLGVSVLF